jgi:thiamine phosphate synthase YjbQ (UPF0047 family)
VTQFNKTLTYTTEKPEEIRDITHDINKIVGPANIKERACLVQSMDTTVGLLLNASETFLVGDLLKHYEHVAPKTAAYDHDNIAERDCSEDEPINGYAPIKASLYANPSITLGVKFTDDTRQRLLLAEFGGSCPRHNKITRQLFVQITGA